MTPSTTHASRRARRDSTAARGSRTRAAPARRRRLGWLVLLCALAGVAGAFALGVGPFGDAVRKITLPLNHEDVIRQQAAAKDLDAALIAAVIYQESRFRPRESSAGAKGLMQILPATAHFIARESGGTEFQIPDLATPEINIRYGSWYLRYLEGRYQDDGLMAAAYNAGETNLDRWIHDAGGKESFDLQEDIPFEETRAYVAGVLEKREEYRKHYAEELGL